MVQVLFCIAAVQLLQSVRLFKIILLKYYSAGVTEIYFILLHYRTIPYPNTLPNYPISWYITELYPILIHCRSILPHSIRSQQFSLALKFTTGVIIGPRRYIHPRGRACKKKSVQLFFFEIVSQFRKWALSLSLCIVEHTQLEPNTEKLSAANQKRARKALNLVSQSEYNAKNPLNFTSQSESSIKSPESPRLRWRSHLGSRLESARSSLSQYIGTSIPPPDLLTHILLISNIVKLHVIIGQFNW